MWCWGFHGSRITTQRLTRRQEVYSLTVNAHDRTRIKGNLGPYSVSG
jgi:ligand-binding SRPBCC domain-containing protein